MSKPAMCLIAVLLVAVPASAQEHMKQIWITQADSGEVLQGRLVELSSASLALLTRDNQRIEIPMDRVLRIETRGDSLKNGAAIGAAILGGLVLASCTSWGGGGQCVAAAAVDAGLGALVGAGVDAMNGGRTAIYKRAAASPAPRANVLGGETRTAASIGFRIRF
jgi:hypothetical protein